jgi:hypothetical protein
MNVYRMVVTLTTMEQHLKTSKHFEQIPIKIWKEGDITNLSIDAMSLDRVVYLAQFFPKFIDPELYPGIQMWNGHKWINLDWAQELVRDLK